MGINDRMIFTTPSREEMVVNKKPVADTECPQCGSDDVKRYGVGWYKGPRMVVKCQACYHTLEVQRPRPEDNWPPFRPAAFDWEASPAERAAAPGRD